MYSTIHKIALIDASHVPAVPLPHKDWPIPMRLGATEALRVAIPLDPIQRVHGAGFTACSLVVGWREEGEEEGRGGGA